MCQGCEVWLHISVKASYDVTAALPYQQSGLFIIACVVLSWQNSPQLSPPPAPEAPLSLWGVSSMLTGV